MCGRYTLTITDEDKLRERFRLTKVPRLKAQYNICPTRPVPAILNTRPGEMVALRWGLVPAWAKETNTAYAMINARVESLLEKPAYRELVKTRRCLVIADSFYEWKKTGGGKEPYRIMLKDEGLFAFAGLWDCRSGADGELLSGTIITAPANELVREIHDRMPVILPKESEAKWLEAADANEALAALKPCAASLLKACRVSKLVNSPENDSAELIRPAPPSNPELIF